MDRNLLSGVAITAYCQVLDGLIRCNILPIDEVDTTISFSVGESKPSYYRMSKGGVEPTDNKKADFAFRFLDVAHVIAFLKGRRRPLLIRGIFKAKLIMGHIDAAADYFAEGLRYGDAVDNVFPSIYKSAVEEKFLGLKTVSVIVGNGVAGGDIAVVFSDKDALLNIFKGKVLLESALGSVLDIVAGEADYDAVIAAIRSIDARDFA